LLCEELDCSISEWWWKTDVHCYHYRHGLCCQYAASRQPKTATRKRVPVQLNTQIPRLRLPTTDLLYFFFDKVIWFVINFLLDFYPYLLLNYYVLCLNVEVWVFDLNVSFSYSSSSSSFNSHTSNKTAVPEQTVHWHNVWMD